MLEKGTPLGCWGSVDLRIPESPFSNGSLRSTCVLFRSKNCVTLIHYNFWCLDQLRYRLPEEVVSVTLVTHGILYQTHFTELFVGECSFPRFIQRKGWDFLIRFLLKLILDDQRQRTQSTIASIAEILSSAAYWYL
jgi:hypothetical protein